LGRGGGKEWEEEEGTKWKRRRGEGGGEKEEKRMERMGRGGGIKWRRWRGGIFLKFSWKSKTLKNYVFLFNFWESKKSLNAPWSLKLDVNFYVGTLSYKKSPEVVCN
jgi:hypothetical protein